MNNQKANSLYGSLPYNLLKFQMLTFYGEFLDQILLLEFMRFKHFWLANEVFKRHLHFNFQAWHTSKLDSLSYSSLFARFWWYKTLRPRQHFNWCRTTFSDNWQQSIFYSQYGNPHGEHEIHWSSSFDVIIITKFCIELKERGLVAHMGYSTNMYETL